MATDRCPHCGALVLPEEKFCRQCGGALLDSEGEAAFEKEEAPIPQGPPRSIEALRAFCERNGMPLEKMRFFIGQDYRQPRAFGIYRDGDTFVVYKNKADGSRAVRYNGPDEAWAVKELYEKLLSECHARDIWPDGRPADLEERRRREKRLILRVTVIVIAMIFAISALVIFLERRQHAHDGYYRYNDDGIYYRYGDDWYYDGWYDGYYYSWAAWSDYPAADYGDDYLGDDYVSSWGASDFEKSSAWQKIQEESHTSSRDYDSWDAGDTDWNSDW